MCCDFSYVCFFIFLFLVILFVKWKKVILYIFFNVVLNFVCLVFSKWFCIVLYIFFFCLFCIVKIKGNGNFCIYVLLREENCLYLFCVKFCKFVLVCFLVEVDVMVIFLFRFGWVCSSFSCFFIDVCVIIFFIMLWSCLMEEKGFLE